MTHSRMNQPSTDPAWAIFSLPIKKFWSVPALPENAKTKQLQQLRLTEAEKVAAQ